VLNQIRVPLSDFAAQGLDLANLRKLELRFGGTGLPATGSIQIADVRFQEAASGPAVYTDKLADVPPTVAPAATPAPEALSVAATTKATAPAAASGPVTASTPASSAAPSSAACSTASAAIASTRVVKRRLTVTGSASTCVSSVRVTVTRVSGARTSKAIRASLKSSKWTAGAALAAGKYRVTVAAVAAKGAKATTASSRIITVK
jgi:hypothetical protein